MKEPPLKSLIAAPLLIIGGMFMVLSAYHTSHAFLLRNRLEAEIPGDIAYKVLFAVFEVAAGAFCLGWAASRIVSKK